MIIRRIHLRNYRGIEAREIELGPGVTILEGPNEIGKSSLAEALRLVFEFMDSSRHRAVQAIAPVHEDAGPEVEIELETGPYHLIYRKRFVKRPETHLRLIAPQAENLTGRAAHERAAQILAETVDVDLWKALQIEQGGAIGQARLADSRSLSKALDEASGGGAAEEEGHLFARATQEYERYFTATGRERALLSEPRQEVARIRQQVQALEERYRALEGDVERCARLAARQEHLAAEVARAEADVVRLDRQWEQVAALEAQVQQAQAVTDNARLKMTAARRNAAERAHAVKTARQARRQLAELRAKAGGDQELLAAARQQHAEATQAVAALRAELAAAAAQAQVRAQDLEYRRDELDAAMLKERHERVVALETRRQAARETTRRIQVTEAALQQLQEAEFDLRQARARLAEGGPAIELQALREIEIEIDGRRRTLTPAQVASLPVTDELSLLLPGHLRMRVTPGHSTAQLQAAAAAAAERRAALYEKYEVESIEAAVAAQAALQRAHRDLEEVDRRIEENLRDLTREDLASRLRSLQARVTHYVERRRSDLPLATDFDEAESLRARAFEARDGVAAKLEEAEGTQEETGRRVQEIEGAHMRAQGQEETLAAQVALLDEELAAARAQVPDEHLAEEQEKLQQGAAQAAARLAEAQARLARLEPEAVGSLRDNAREVLAGLKKEEREVAQDLAGAQARLEALQEAGIHEELGRCRADLEQAEQAYDRVARRSEAARLLFQVLEKHRNAAKKSYVKPLSERIEGLGRIVFGPTFRICLADDLEIESRTLEERTIPYESLSKGAQEQLGILTRLAVAMLVAASGGVPLILDDTLGNTDPERLQSMGAMLARAGRECQIIVLTCTPDRFRSVGGARIERLGSRPVVPPSPTGSTP